MVVYNAVVPVEWVKISGLSGSVGFIREQRER